MTRHLVLLLAVGLNMTSLARKMPNVSRTNKLRDISICQQHDQCFYLIISISLFSQFNYNFTHYFSPPSFDSLLSGFACPYAHTRMHACRHTHMHACTYIYIYTCMYLINLACSCAHKLNDNAPSMSSAYPKPPTGHFPCR